MPKSHLITEKHSKNIKLKILSKILQLFLSAYWNVQEKITWKDALKVDFSRFLLMRQYFSSNIEIWTYECSTKWILLRPGGRKHILVSTFVIRMQRLHFCLWRKFYVLLAVECLWVIKLNKTIISVLVYAESTRQYNSSMFIFSIKVILFEL